VLTVHKLRRELSNYLGGNRDANTIAKQSANHFGSRIAMQAARKQPTDVEI
jgi:hypothetical protein